MEINAKSQKVKVRNTQYHKNNQGRDEPEVEIPYDFLVMALGARTNFHNTPGAEKYSLPLYDLTDAKRIKNQIIESFEKAGYLKNEADIKRALCFVVVGGGPTGVELAAEIADLIFNEIKDSFPSLSKHAEVALVHSGNFLLPRAEKWFSINALKNLEKLKVRVLLSSKVKEVTERNIELDGESIPTENVFWTAGVEARETPVITDRQIEKDPKTNRIKVNEFLQIPEIPNVFVAGDMAYICNKEERQPYPMRAQFAVREGVVAGQNIKKMSGGRPLKEFHWKDMGFIVSLGRKNAVAKLFGLKFKGRPAWFAYRSAYFLKVIGLKAKVRTAVEWTLNLFLPRDVSKF